MKNILVLLLFVAGSINGFSQNQINIGERFLIPSTILGDERAISVYFPPSYYFNSKQKFPVLYILDGDYNFQYVAGLLELWGGISEDIPEMILVAISGKGSKTYRRNCKPNIPNIEDAGNADAVIRFMKDELIPYVNENFKSNGYKILAGHSVGGIFVTYTSLTHPHLFDNYIAISPALWWGDNAMDDLFKEMYKDKKYVADIYFSLADEKGMGVKKFIKIVKKKSATSKFKQFPKENHNSVGNKTYQWALQYIFKDWKIPNQYFSSNEDVISYFKTQNAQFNQCFRFPAGAISYTHYILESKPDVLNEVRKSLWKNSLSAGIEMNNQLAIYFIDKKNYSKSILLLNEIFQKEPNNFKALENLAKLHLAKGEIDIALEQINLSIEIATHQKARQWMINELIETMETIEKK